MEIKKVEVSINDMMQEVLADIHSKRLKKLQKKENRQTAWLLVYLLALSLDLLFKALDMPVISFIFFVAFLIGFTAFLHITMSFLGDAYAMGRLAKDAIVRPWKDKKVFALQIDLSEKKEEPKSGPQETDNPAKKQNKKA